MKKLLLLLCLLVPVVCVVGAYAQAKPGAVSETASDDSQSEDNSAMSKLGRGAVNVVTCWKEVPAGVEEVSKEEEPVKGVILGSVYGACRAAVRAFTGVLDTLTFWMPPYNKPAMKPDYARAYLAGAAVCII